MEKYWMTALQNIKSWKIPWCWVLCSRFLMCTSVWWRGRHPDCSWLPVWSQCRRGGACPEASCAHTGWPRFPGTSYGRLKNTAKQINPYLRIATDQYKNSCAGTYSLHTLPKLQERVVTSSHSAPWNTTRLSHSRHLDGALSFLSLCVWAALDIWVFLKGPGELAVSITISLKPEGTNAKKKQRASAQWGPEPQKVFGEEHKMNRKWQLI